MACVKAQSKKGVIIAVGYNYVSADLQLDKVKIEGFKGSWGYLSTGVVE